MSEIPAVHATFVIERVYDASPARVFAAWSDPAAKAAWFVGPNEWRQLEREHDFRVGGKERAVGGFPNGTVTAFDARYHDIVQGQRIVYAYDMRLNERHISVSLATVTFHPEGSGTKLIFTEQAVFLDGYDDAGSREHGTRALLEQLGATLA